jgi:DNA-binding NarL/FixJ family response regulator
MQPRKRVFIAEDDSLLRVDLRAMLTRMGYDVVGEAVDGSTALMSIRRLRPDLAILDIRMPVMNGLTAAAHIAERLPAAVLFVTGWDYDGACRLAREVGAIGCLSKPFSEQQLAQVLNHWAASVTQP